MNNVKSAKEVKFQNYLNQKIKNSNKASSSYSSRQQSVNQTKTEQLTTKYKQTVKSNHKSLRDPCALIYLSICKRNLTRHSIDNFKYCVKLVNDIIYDKKKQMVSVFKDYLLWDENSDFLKRVYFMSESLSRLPKICGYYERYTLMRPVYFKLTCTKIMLKNMKRHKKLLELIEENENDMNKQHSEHSYHYRQLIQSSSITDLPSMVDHAKEKKIERHKESSYSLSLNCNDISKKCDQATNNDIATLSNIINNLSLNTSSQKDKNPLDTISSPLPPQQLPSPVSRGYCYTECNFIKDETSTSPSNLTLNSKTQKKEKFLTMKTHGKNLKRINIKKLDLKNINRIIEEPHLSHFTESKRLLTDPQVNQYLTSVPLTSNERKSNQPSPCICFKSDYMKKKFNYLSTLIQTKAILEHSSVTKKKVDNIKPVKLSSKGKIMTIKEIMKNIKTERDSHQVNNLAIKNFPLAKSNKNILLQKNVPSIKKCMVSEFTKKPLKIINSQNALSSHSKQAPILNKPKNGVISSGSNTASSPIYNINLNLNLNLNIPNTNKASTNSHCIMDKTKYKLHENVKDFTSHFHTNINSNEIRVPLTDRISICGKNVYGKVDQLQSFANVLFNTKIQTEKIFSPNKTGNKKLSRNLNDKNCIVNYQSINSKPNTEKLKGKKEKVMIQHNNRIIKFWGGILPSFKIPKSTDLIKHDSREINYSKAIFRKKRTSINLKKNIVNNNYVDMTRKYPLTSRNEREKIPLDILNKIAAAHK